MKKLTKWLILVAALASLAWLMFGPFHFNKVAADDEEQSATHVRWDIIHLDFSTTPNTVRAGGEAFASVDANHVIRFTGSGTFVAPASGGTSNAVTGGGTWETFGPGGVLTGSGTYHVTGLASWQFANFQFPPPVLNDTIDHGKGANGNAILRIAYSDGSQGILGVGCHGPGAPDGIQEGVIATKGYFTYWTREAPVAGVDKDRTSFHIMQKKE